MLTCFECGSPESIHRHHVVPKSLGGRKTVPLCYLCHAKVHNRKALDIGALSKAVKEDMREKNIYRGGPRPFGYSISGKTLIENPDELQVIVVLQALRELGWSYRALHAAWPKHAWQIRAVLLRKRCPYL